MTSSDPDRPLEPLGPLNPASVVTAGFRLYRDRFKDYFQLAAIGMLWLVGGIVVMALIIGVLAGIGAAVGGEVLVGLAILVGIVVGLVPLFYGIARFSMMSAAISRLAFRDVTNRPETPAEALRLLAPKMWNFLTVGLLVGLYIVVAYAGISLLSGLVAAALGLVIFFLFSAVGIPEIGIGLGIALGALLFVVLLVAGITWVGCRLLLPDTILALETARHANRAVGRSWQMTKLATWRIALVWLVAFIVTLPLSAIANYPLQIPLLFLDDSSAIYWVFYALAQLMSIAVNILTLPFWQSIKGVLYYDLRNRREGLDLQLRTATEGDVS